MYTLQHVNDIRDNRTTEWLFQYTTYMNGDGIHSIILVSWEMVNHGHFKTPSDIKGAFGVGG